MKKGFALVELMIVVFMIILMISIIVPNIIRTNHRKKCEKCDDKSLEEIRKCSIETNALEKLKEKLKEKIPKTVLWNTY